MWMRCLAQGHYHRGQRTWPWTSAQESMTLSNIATTMKATWWSIRHLLLIVVLELAAIQCVSCDSHVRWDGKRLHHVSWDIHERWDGKHQHHGHWDLQNLISCKIELKQPHLIKYLECKLNPSCTTNSTGNRI